MQMTAQGWGYLCDKSSQKRKDVLSDYAKRFIVPMFQDFPELVGKVYLALRKEGFFAYPKPVYNIIVPSNVFEHYGEYQIRFITAHEMLHLVQYTYNIGISEWNVGRIERQATFMAFARGYAYDFVNSFPEYCSREQCDMNDKTCYYKCRHIFSKPCRQYSNIELRETSIVLENLAKEYTMTEFPDYIEVVERALHTNK